MSHRACASIIQGGTKFVKIYSQKIFPAFPAEESLHVLWAKWEAGSSGREGADPCTTATLNTSNGNVITKKCVSK